MLRRLPVLAVLALAIGLAGCSKSQKTETTTTNATDSTINAAPPAATSPNPIATDTSSAPGASAENTMPVRPATPPAHIEVQHILIGFQGSVPNKPVTRTKAEAETLAKALLARARKGENMDALVQEYTDDQFPGVYDLANDGVKPDPARQEIARSGMVKGFSDAAFSLSVGNVGISNYDPNTSPYGWHIIKRLR